MADAETDAVTANPLLLRQVARMRKMRGEPPLPSEDAPSWMVNAGMVPVPDFGGARSSLLKTVPPRESAEHPGVMIPPTTKWQAMLEDPLGNIMGAGGVAKASVPFATRASRAAVKEVPKTPRYDPGSPQQLIPGVEPLTLEQARGRAMDEYQQALRGMTFEDANRGLRFEYDPEWKGSALGSSTREPGAWNPDYLTEGVRGEYGDYRQMGKRPAREIRGSRIFRRELEDPGSRTVPDAFDTRLRGATAQAEVGAENFQQMMERNAQLRAAEREAMILGEQEAITRARELNSRINRKRAMTSEPGMDQAQSLQLQEQILSALRQRPVEVMSNRTRMIEPFPGEGLQSPVEWRNLLGSSVQPPEDVARAISDQTRLVRQLRGEPEPGAYTPPPRSSARIPALRSEADAMNRPAVEAFYREARGNPKLFEFGGEPPANVRDIEGMARHFGQQSGERIHVDYGGGESDEPYKIEVAKEHGRGEVMRDRYGDYKYETHASGDKPKYDQEGNLVTKEVEGHGPPEEGDRYASGLTMDMPKPARGGEIVFEEGSGEPQYLKSEGGEPMLDERGRVKYTKEENPDYRDSEPDTLELRVAGKGGPLTVHDWGGEPTVTSTEVGKSAGKAGALMYQTLLADASRRGYEIGSQSLTEQNRLRLLANANANYARMGVNPRDVSGTASGLATPARGLAEGPEMWRAEAEEIKQRMRSQKVDPTRVRFDGNEFTVDGRTVEPDKIATTLGWRAGELNIGQKSIMRMAFFDWLRGASPEEAQQVAKGWGKLGPMIGIGAAAVGTGAMLGGAQNGEEQ